MTAQAYRLTALIGLLLAGLTPTAPALAQDGGADWVCDAGICLEREPTVVFSQSGTFRSGEDLAAADQTDRIAALEQQSQREFEFAMTEAAAVAAQVTQDEAGDAAVSVLMWASPDGKSFSRIAQDDVVDPGDVLLVAVRQARSDNSDRISYLPASWTLQVTQRRLVLLSDPVARAAPPLLPVLVSADGDPAPEDAADGSDVPAVTGAAALRDITAPCTGDGCDGAEAAAVEGPVQRELAAELQRELARVGCYRAAIDGLWGPASRRALAAFSQATRTEPGAGQPSARVLVQVSQADAPVCRDD